MATGRNRQRTRKNRANLQQVARSRKGLEDQRTNLSDTGYNSSQLSGISEVSDISGAFLDVRVGSWLRDNALTRLAMVHDPVNVVGQG
jgi:hypothetical protein